jgi:photosystem II stability/assembly factor-like uncharacterized protein
MSQSIPISWLISVEFINASDGWIAGMKNGASTIFKSTNGGLDWSYQTFALSSTLHKICFVDEYIGWFCGEGGVIFHTTDGGVNWIWQSSGTSGHLYSIHFVDQNFGWAVGTAGLIIRTTNGGLNWQNQSVQPNYYLESVYFVNENVGWTVGNNGVILKTIDGGGPTFLNNESEMPNEFLLFQNYPNPFNPATTIAYQIPDRGFVTLKVYDILGREVATLVNEEKPAGSYEVQFTANGLASGIYFYKLSANEYSETKKMILLK